MAVEMKPMRFAHSEGHTDVCYDDTGRYLLTCGSDGDVRIYDGFEDDDPESFRAGETITAVRYKNERVITASDNAVQIFKFPEGSPDGLITRFTGEVYHIVYSSSGKYLAAGGSDFDIKVVSIDEKTHSCLQGHEAPILSLSFDPDEKYVASSSCDGTIKIWEWKEQICVKTLSLLAKSSDISISDPLCRLAFRPNNTKCLAVPINKEIRIYEKESWNHLFTLKDEAITETISIVCWSSCGDYLAAATINGGLLVWRFNSKTVVAKAQHDKLLTITCVAWDPRQNGEIAYTDNQGQLGICSNVIPKHGDISLESKKITSTDGLSDNDELNVDELLNDDGSETGSLLGGKKKHRVKNSWFDDEADDQGINDDDDENTTDIGKIKAELAGPMGLEDEDSNQIPDDNKSVKSEVTAPVVVVPSQPQIMQQRPFQPGSTPVHLMHRFMVWNDIGIIRCHSEDEPSSIDIEFHDTTFHHAMHVVNHMGHTMAALSNTAVLLACPTNEEIPSKLVCLHFGTWDRSKEWTVSLPEGENIMAIAVGSSWAAAVTNYDTLRIFTIGGLQLTIVSLPGSVVAMSGHGDQLLLVYHNGVPSPTHQCLAVKLIDIASTRHVITEQRLPLSPKSNLSWLGFSLEGTPVTVDSLGVVRLLNRLFDNSWSPVANTKNQVKRSSDNFWVIGVTEHSEQIRCILCTGSTYPPTLPRPLPTTLPLQLPVCELSTEKGQLEENYMRSCLLGNRMEYQKQCGSLDDESELERNQNINKQLLMKQFALSCKLDREFRALEICQLLPDAYSVSFAIKYASRMRRMNLAQKLDELARRKASEEEEAAAEEPEEYVEERYNSGRDERRRDTSGRRSNGDEGREEVEDVEDEEMQEEDATQESVLTQSGLKSTSLIIPDSLSDRPKLKVAKYETAYSQETKQRSNPFKKDKKPSDKGTNQTSNNKRFLENVENGLSTQKKLTSPPNKTSSSGKQVTLFSKNKPKNNQENGTGNKKRSAFQCWLVDMKPFLQDENPDLSQQDVMKIAMKQWRETPKEEKQVWENKVKNEVKEGAEKKRKRKTEDETTENNEITDSGVMEEKGCMAKKVKSVDEKPSIATAKLAGFAFAKKQ